MEQPVEFDDIRTFHDSEFHDKMTNLVKEPGFEHAIRYVMPDVDYNAFTNELLTLHTKNEFQKKMMEPFLEMLVKRTSSGLSANGLKYLENDIPYTYITNHRDIVLDASFLNLVFLRINRNTSEVAIGNNLLIFDWIADLVRLNKSFIVKRDLSMRKALEAAKKLSSYIHFTINEKKESVWIAQREGRAKDSNDQTQESLIKMLGMAGGGDLKQNLLQLNLMPVSISYEYDPNDYLKAKEFLEKSKNPDFHKTAHDDLLSMETGMLQYKGQIHFEFAQCINSDLLKIPDKTDKIDFLHDVIAIVNKAIHSNYLIYPGNYIAHDLIYGKQFADKYNSEQYDIFKDYISKQLSKLGEVSAEDYEYLKEKMLIMYANPLKNKLLAVNA